MTTNNACNYSPTQYTIQSGGANGQLTSISAGVSNSTLQGSTGAAPSFTTTPQIVGLGIGAASTGTGLTFDGSSTLSTYSIGTFTPGIAFGGTSVGVTYSTQTGFYTKIGNIVCVSMNIVLTSKGSSTGGMTFTGLPFTVNITSPRTAILANNITFVGGFLGAVFSGSTTTGVGNIYKTASTALQLINTNFADNSSFMISGFYYST